MNPREHATSTIATNRRDSDPEGNARRAVRGFLASSSASKILFAAIATVRAVTMQMMISDIFPAVGAPATVRPASTALRIAHGIAKTVW